MAPLAKSARFGSKLFTKTLGLVRIRLRGWIIAKTWRSNLQRIIPLFDFPPEIRRVIYTTNTIESVNMSLRKNTKNRGSLPNN
jgi:transposase-like protein